jgi:hypothetical protein
MKNKLSKTISYTLIAILVLGMLSVFSVIPVKADPTTLEVINALDGTHDFNYTTDTLSVGATIVINITVVGVTDLQNWQIKLTWDASMLSYVSAVLPSDHVFSQSGKSMILGGPTSTADSVSFGCTYINTPYWTFNGTGQLCQVTLQVTDAPTDPISDPERTCDLALVNPPTDTFILNGAGHDITFSIVNGRFFYEYVVPTIYPILYTKPATEKPAKIDDIFGLEIWVRNVSSAWQIIGFQFSLMWNTTFIEPAIGPGGNYFDNGTFLEGFQYYPDGVLYTADIDKHIRVPPYHTVPDGYNFSMFGALLLPDLLPDPAYHSPFPSVGIGGAKLMTVYFKAIYETLSPVEDWTWITFIQFDETEDTYAIRTPDTYGNPRTLPVTSEPCHYRAPMKVAGLAIDLYTQYDAPYGGQGPHQPSDMFGPQQEVELYAEVLYNEYPVQQKLVGFEVRHGDYDFWREAATNEMGIAHVSFRIPWPCDDPESEIFGKWIVIATVEVAEQVRNDTLGFWVWWKVVVLSNEPKETSYVQRKTGGDPLTFTNMYGTYSMQEIPVTFTETVYDELGFFVGSDYMSTTVGWGEYMYYDYLACESPPFLSYAPWDVTIPLPTNAVVGMGRVYTNAFDMFPWLGGTPYCPEVTNTIDFYIVAPTP